MLNKVLRDLKKTEKLLFVEETVKKSNYEKKMNNQEKKGNRQKKGNGIGNDKKESFYYGVCSTVNIQQSARRPEGDGKIAIRGEEQPGKEMEQLEKERQLSEEM
ncbi:hypothetical protein QYF36_022278 [Acer negundo]|nr:hypothetical protein QYF36_022278 [Acer negundo]